MKSFKNRHFAGIFTFVVIIVCFFLPGKTYSQWARSSEGVFGGPITGITNVGTTMVAGTYDGVYLSNDGIEWHRAGAGISFNLITSVLGVGDNLYASANFYKQNFLSKDKGLTWIPFEIDLTIIQYRAIGNNVFALSNDGKLYKIQAGTTSTEEIATPTSYVMDFTTAGHRIFITTIENNSVYMSSDLGLTWAVIPGLVNAARSMDAMDQVVVAGKNISADNGDHWQTTSLPLGNYHVMIAGNKTFLGDQGHVYSSTDGINWTLFDGLPTLFRGSNATAGVLYAATLNGVFRSVDGGATWTDSNIGIRNGNISAVMTKGPLLFVANVNRIYSSNNVGASWTQLPAQIPPDMVVRSMIVSGNNILAGAAGTITDASGAFISFNDGASWSPVDPSLPGANSFAKVRSDLYAGNKQGVYVSHDNGVTWSLVPGSPTDVTGVFGIGGTLFAAHFGNLYRYSADEWKLINSNPGYPIPVSTGNVYEGQVFAMVNIGTQIFCGIHNEMIHTSTDNGDTWKAVSGYSATNMTVVGSQLYRITLNEGITVSTDRGKSWLPFNNGLAGIINMGFFYGPMLASTGYALVVGTWGSGPFVACGLFSQNADASGWNGDTTSVPGGSPVIISGNLPTTLPGISIYGCSNIKPPYFPAEPPETGILSQNQPGSTNVVTGDLNAQPLIQRNMVYPNPAKERIEIDLGSFMTGSAVSITLVDVVGKQLASLQGRGGEKITVDTENYSRGVYLVDARSGESRVTERFVRQ